MQILADIKKIVKQKKDIISLGLLIFLIVLFAFSIGWILMNNGNGEEMRFEYENLEDS